MTLYVGTSGFAYKEWKPDFYPEDLPRSKFLEHYGRLLSACEINATFYRLQKHETVARWAAATPETFRFSMKAHRSLTHGRTVALDDDKRSLLEAWLASVRMLGERLGIVLFQYPPYRRRDDDGLSELLGALGELRFAVEFRHASWDHPGVSDRIAEAGGTTCVSETVGKVPASLPPGPVAYVRLRNDRYGEDERAGWAELLRAEAVRRDVFAFAKHEGIPADDPYGGIGLAQWLSTHALPTRG